MLVVTLGSIDPRRDAPWLLRIQLSCLAGEAFSSIDCDCALQLSAALHALHEAPAGLLVYFPDTDGCGLGLKAKLRLVELEEKLDLPPIAAAEASGEDHLDLSRLRIVTRVLEDWGVNEPVLLLTSSAAKVRAVRDAGVRVAEVRPLDVDVSGLSHVGRREAAEKNEQRDAR